MNINILIEKIQNGQDFDYQDRLKGFTSATLKEKALRYALCNTNYHWRSLTSNEFFDF